MRSSLAQRSSGWLNVFALETDKQRPSVGTRGEATWRLREGRRSGKAKVEGRSGVGEVEGRTKGGHCRITGLQRAEV